MQRATLWRRLGAMTYDAMLILAVWILTLFIMVPLNQGEVHGAGVQLVFFLEAYFFFIYFWRRDGQTVGMLAWQVRICANDGGPLSLSQLTMRFAGAFLSAACLGLGYLWALVDPLGRTWGDLMSGTYVAHEPRPTA